MKRALFALAVLLFAGASRADVLRIVVNDVIHPINDEYIGRVIEVAEKQNADALVIELRTPGGLMDSMRAIVEKILKSKVPVIVYVSPSGSYAASAGFFILESADIAAMAPGTNTGAAHPVATGGEMDDVMKAKVENDAAAFMRTVAQKRGRNVAVAESAVLQSKSFTESEALKHRLIEVIAPNLPSLLKWADGRTLKRWDGSTVTLKLAGKPVRELPMTMKERLLSPLMNPNIAFMLFSIGMLALWAELSHPGAVGPGVVGAICILLAVFALNLLPVRYASLALLIVAFILFVLEAKFAAHGVFGVSGVLCMVFGALFLVDGPIPELRVHLLTALVVSVPLGAICIFLMTLGLKAHQKRVETGTEGMIGEIGVARTALAPDGKVFVHGELWNAIASAPVAAGSRVRVSAVDGLRVRVEPVDSSATDTPTAPPPHPATAAPPASPTA